MEKVTKLLSNPSDNPINRFTISDSSYDYEYNDEYFKALSKWASKTKDNFEINNHKLTGSEMSEIIKSAFKCKTIKFSYCTIDSKSTGFDFKINDAYQIETLYLDG